MKYWIFIALLCLTWECNKIELPLVTEPKPIFELNADVSGNPIKLSAGLKNVILHTDYQTGPFEMLSLQGLFRDQTCSAPNCKQSFALRLRYRFREFVKDTTKSIVRGPMLFFKGSPDSLMMKSKNNSLLAGSANAKYNYVWTIDGNKFSDREVISFGLKPNFKSKVCLNITHPDGSYSDQCQTIDFSSIDSFQGLKVTILPVQLSNKLWNLKAQIEGGLEPIKYVWENKSTIPGTSNNPVTELEIKSASNHCLTIYDARGNTASACIDLQPEAKVKSRADFDVNVLDQNMLREFVQFNTVELIYTDEAGLVWSTASKNQKSNSAFEIIQIAPFQNNDMKQATKKLQISFNADFFNATRSPISIKGTATIAVAFPR